jgi:ATP-binding cassette, subfamily B, bacterial MsbA
MSERDREKQETRAAVSRLWRDYLRVQKLPLFFAVLLMLVIASTTAALAYLLDPAIKYLFLEKQDRLLYLIPIIVIGVATVKALATYGEGNIMATIGQRLVADLQLRLFRTMVYADLKRLNRTHSGEFMTNTLNNVTLVQQASVQAIAGFAKELTSVLGLLAVMYYQDWILALVASAIIPLVVWNSRKQGRKTRKATKKQMAETGILTSLISENLDGTRVVKAYGQEEREIERTGRSIQRRMTHQLKAARAKLAAAPVTEAITGIGIAAVLFYGGLRGMSGDFTINQFMSFLGAMMLSYDPLKKLSNLFTILSQGTTALTQVFEEIDTAPEVIDDPDAQDLELEGGQIEFKSVSFGYNSDRAALGKVSFLAAPGETIALVGPSGAGKSTVLNLLPRFYDIDEGAIEIDGQDIRELTLRSLRAPMAMVTQDPFLFDDTIAANIAYAKPDASQEEIEAAAKAAAAHDFIMENKDGYEAQVGEGGSQLSGGQRQRIAIARAMLKNAPILLLDEATSALDTRSEAQVQTALKALMKDRTTLVIAHRLSTIIDADRIFVMDRGHIVESGKHGELLSSGKLYSSLYSAIFKDDKERVLEAGE